MSRHDELVEEIQDIWKAGRERRVPNVSPQQLIARIGKAYADGELELPREVGRSKGSYLPGIGECETIALREEEE